MLEEAVYRLKGCFIQNTLQKVYETKTYKLERTFEKKTAWSGEEYHLSFVFFLELLYI